jgi:hypothetical protein
MAHELLHEDETLQALEQIASSVAGRDIAVRVIDAPAAAEVPVKTEAPQLQKPTEVPI